MHIKRKSKIILAIFSLLISLNVSAQLSVQTTVIPPYSPYLSDYYGYKEKLTVRIINPTQNTYQVRLQGNLKGGNNINLSIKQNYKPAQFISVPPGVTNIKGAQLSSYFTDKAMNFSGITKQEVSTGNGLPEGNYKICFWATQYNGVQNLSTPNQGCASLKITHFETPKLNSPSCNSEIMAKQPQNIVFNWTIPAGVMPSDIEYELMMVEVNPSNLNATQAFKNATEPVFFKKVTSINNYIYNLSDPKLEKGKTYAWRVRAMPKLGKQANFKNNGYSIACKFLYKNSDNLQDYQEGEEEEEEDPPQDFEICEADCVIEAPVNNTPKLVKVNDNVFIGKFTMVVKTINGGSGTGTIKIPFLNVNVAVKFNNLQVNTDGKAFGDSKVTAEIGGNSLVDNALANDPNGEIALTADKMNDIKNYIHQGQKLVSKFSPDMEAIPIPFAQDNKGFDWNILGLIFTPTKAYMNAAFGMELADAFDNNWVDFGMKGICIRPNGYGSMPYLKLKTDKDVELSNDVKLLIKGGEATSVTFSCNGIEQVHLEGEFIVSRNKLLPHDGNKVILGEENKVKAVFSINVTQNNDWIVETTMQPNHFVVPDAKDIILTAESAVLDQSDIQNANTFSLHPNHPKSASEKDWKGLFIKNVIAELPKEFMKNEQFVSFGLSNLVVDKTGLWVKGNVSNPISLEEGSLGGWKFSIANVFLDIQASVLSGGSLEGDLRLPIAKTSIAYTAALSKGENGVDYNFSIGNLDEIDADLWLAKLKLNPGSKVIINKENNIVTPSAILNGEISIGLTKSPDNQTALSKLSLKDIKFQELSISGGNSPQVDFAFVSLQAQSKDKQHSMNKFPLNLSELTYENQGGPGIVFGIGINLVKGSNGFQADTKLKIKGKFNPQEKVFQYDGMDLQKVGIDATLGVIKLDGEIDLYKDDPTYGTGFRGDISATVSIIGVAIDATLQVGKIGDGLLENNENYRYWYADLSARFSTGLVVPGAPAIAFYGFSGGAYKNMQREAANPIANASIPDIKGETNDMTAGASRSGIVYTPKKGKLGFMAGVTLGTAGEPTAFNADLKLTVEFNTDNFGISKIAMDGAGYIMGPILDREKRLLEVMVTIEADFDQPSFDANVTINGGFNESVLKVTVAASLNIHASPDAWWVKLGYWTNDNEPWNDPKRIQVDVALDAKILKASLNFNAYFMMGTDIGDLPRSPLKVRNMLSQNGKSDVDKTIPSDVNLGKGFAFGAGIKFDANLDFLFFYTDIEFILGGDFVLSKSNLTCNGSNDYGINQWYAKGNAFAYLDVDAGVQLNMWLWKGKFSLVQLQTAAEIKAELPNPYYMKGQFALNGSLFGGLIKINTSYKMEVGKKCEWGNGENIDEIPIVEELRPENNEKTSVFAAPQASFNFPIGETLILKDEKGKKKTVKFSIDYVILRKAPSNVPGPLVIPGKYHFNTSRTGITFLANNTLPQKSTLIFQIKTRCKEYKNGKWKSIRTEEKAVVFKSDIAPDYIAPENVVKAYPQIGQRYFLQDDATYGDITVGLSQCYLLNKKEDSKFKYQYKLQVKNVETGSRQLVNFTCNGKNFRYKTPKLANETVYEVRFLRLAKPKNSNINTKNNTKSQYTNLKGMPVSYKPTKTGNLNLGNLYKPKSKGITLGGISGNKIKFNNGGKVLLKAKSNSTLASNSVLVKKNKLKFDQSKSGTITKVLFKYYFRTSKYNRSSEKYGNHYKAAGFGGMSYQQKSYGKTFLTSIPFPLIHGDENMDVYDAYGYNKKNFNIYVNPLVKLKIDWSNEGWYKKVNTEVYGAKYKNNNTATTKAANLLAYNRFAQVNFFGRKQLGFSSRPKEAIKIWSPYTEGPINLYNNQKILKPKGKLTSSEIAKAKKGIKLNEKVGQKYVIPITDFSPAVVVLDAIKVYYKHRSWCNSDHLFKSYEKSCYKAEANPLLNGMPLSMMTINPFGYFKLNSKLKYNLTYGYYKDQPFNKKLIYKHPGY